MECLPCGPLAPMRKWVIERYRERNDWGSLCTRLEVTPLEAGRRRQRVASLLGLSRLCDAPLGTSGRNSGCQ